MSFIGKPLRLPISYWSPEYPIILVLLSHTVSTRVPQVEILRLRVLNKTVDPVPAYELYFSSKIVLSSSHTLLFLLSLRLFNSPPLNVMASLLSSPTLNSKPPKYIRDETLKMEICGNRFARVDTFNSMKYDINGHILP